MQMPTQILVLVRINPQIPKTVYVEVNGKVGQQVGKALCEMGEMNEMMGSEMGIPKKTME